MNKVINVKVAGLGGQGILKATDILAEAAFLAGYDVKKSEVHGMSQRGGSVSSDVRFGDRVASPMIPDGETDFLVILEMTQVEVNRHELKPDGVMITVDMLGAIENPKAANTALLGLLSKSLPIPRQAWHEALKRQMPARLLELNLRIFDAAAS